MATIKSYTDLEQSRKLVDILPIESADMCFINNKPHLGFLFEEYHEFGDTILQDYYPCWSLAALLDVLKDDIKIEKTLFDQSDMFTYSILGEGYEYRTYEHENLVDACYEMIVKLHEQKLLQL